MTIRTSTLRPGFLVSLKTSVRGNVHYFRKDINTVDVVLTDPPAADGQPKISVDRWETERRIEDPQEHEAAKKARSKAAGLVRSVCAQSAFGLLCPEVDAEKLEGAITEARKVVDAFNDGAMLSRISIFVLTGRVMPDDVEAVRAINSEIRELMAAMSGGIENGNISAIRDAASKVKGIGEMLAVDAQTKVEMAVKTAREVAKQMVKDRDAGAVAIDKSAVRRINELRTAFLDLDDDEADVAAPKMGAGRQLDLAAAE